MRLGAISASALIVAGCAVIPKKEQVFAFPNPANEAAAAPETAPAVRPPPETQKTKPIEDRLIYYRGVKGSFAAALPDDALAGRAVSLEFVSAPAADVARTIISDVLGETVSVTDGVQGTVTLSAPEPVPASEALSLLESVLAESGLALIRNKDGFLLTTLAKAGDETAPVNRQGAAIGYGVAVAPVRYATPAEIVGLIGPFTSDRLTITPDDSRTAIILKGPQSDIETAIDAIETFDTPHLTDRTFGMFRLQYADAATLKAEIGSVTDAATAGAGSPIDIVALPRLNLLFVTARTREAFDEVRGWIEQLDEPSGGDERRLRYYQVLNSSAETLADQLNAAFGGSSGAAGEVADPDAPGGADSAIQPAFRAAPTGGGRSEVSIAVDTANNALIIRATDQEYREALDLIERMDVLAPQVLIEATIAEVTLNDTLEYGVRWFFENAESRVSFPGQNPGGGDDNNPRTSLGRFPALVPGLNYSFAANNVSAAIDALAAVTDVTVVSAPSIMVLNNQSAHLQVGDEVPIVTQQAQSVIDPDAPLVSTLQLRETGVILDVKPRINASDVVVLEIEQEVSDVAETTTSGIDSPTIQQRKFTSTVAVRNNGVVALGGLIRENYTDRESGVPLLKDIPALGNAFKSRDVTKRRTELIVFLTPRIIRTDNDAKNAIKYIRREMRRLGQPDS
ncbi:MAG: type II secretion system secretin GspD, partial [Pseudomonadota bacterium]